MAVLTSIRQQYFPSVPELKRSTGKYPKGITIYCDPDGCGTQKTQVWPPIYDLTLGALSVTNYGTSDSDPYFITPSDYDVYVDDGNETGLSGQGACQTATFYDADDPAASTSTVSCYGKGGTGYALYTILMPSFNRNYYASVKISAYANGHYESYTSGTSYTHYCSIYAQRSNGNGGWSYVGSNVTLPASTGTVTFISQQTISIDNYIKYWYSGDLRVWWKVGYYGGSLYGMHAKLIPVRRNASRYSFTTTIDRNGGPNIKYYNITSSGDAYDASTVIGLYRLRDNALQYTYATGSFPSSHYNQTYTITASTYQVRYLKEDGLNYIANPLTNDNSFVVEIQGSMDYNASGKTLKIPNNNYVYNSYVGNISAQGFGYYFTGYITLPTRENNKSYVWYTSASKNYTGAYLADFNPTSYISRFRFKSTSWKKGWYTTRRPIGWYGSFSNSSNSTTYTIYRMESTDGDIADRLAGIFLSTSTSATFSWNNGGGDASAVGGSVTMDGGNDWKMISFQSSGTHGESPYVSTFGSTAQIPTSARTFVNDSTNGNYVRLTLNEDFLSNIRSALSINCQVLDSNAFTSNTGNGLRWSVTNSGSQSSDSYYVTSSKSSRTLYIYSCWYKAISGFKQLYIWGMQRHSVTIYWNNNPGQWEFKVTHN